jgi:hypothetical protein
VSDPPIEKKIELLRLMEQLGIHGLCIGLPGAGGSHAAGIERLAREIADHRMKIIPNCLARTDLRDIRPIIGLSQRTGIPYEHAKKSPSVLAEDEMLALLPGRRGNLNQLECDGARA